MSVFGRKRVIAGTSEGLNRRTLRLYGAPGIRTLSYNTRRASRGALLGHCCRPPSSLYSCAVLLHEPAWFRSAGEGERMLTRMCCLIVTSGALLSVQGQVEPAAGSWRTWVIKAGSEVTVAP